MLLHLNHLASLHQFLGDKKSKGYRGRLRRVMFMDESYYKTGELFRQVLSDVPHHRDQRKPGKPGRGRGADGKMVSCQKINMWAVINSEKCWALKCTFDTGDDQSCVEFFCQPLPWDATLGAGEEVFDIVANATEKPIMLIDRLGGGGVGALSSAKQHFNPRIKRAANYAGVGLKLLNVHGGYVNAIEIFWHVLKKRVSTAAPPGPPRFDNFGNRIRGPSSWDEFKVMVRQEVEKMNKNPALFRSFVHRRGLGSEFHARWRDTAEYKEALPQVEPYDIVKVAFRPNLVQHSAEPPKTRHRAASYAKWWLANARCDKRMVPKTPPPGPAGPRGADGWENTCRLCGTGCTERRPWPLLCCEVDGCNSAWHAKCLGLPGVPPGRWECPCCELAPGKKCHPRWPTVTRVSKKSAKPPKPGQFLTDTDEDSDADDE